MHQNSVRQVSFWHGEYHFLGIVMGYLGFCYVDSKSFEFRYDVSGGVRLAERSRSIFPVVILGWSSIVWLMKAMEGFTKGDESSENWRNFCLGSTTYVVLRRTNKHGQYIELSEYGGGGRRSFVVILEGSDGKGWMDCWVQLQRLRAYHEQIRLGRTSDKMKLADAPTMTRLRREGHSYVAAVEGKPTDDMRPVDGRGSLSNTGTQQAPNMVIPQLQAGDHATGAGESSFKLGDVMQYNLKGAENLKELKSFLRCFKVEAERWLGLLGLGREHKGEEKLGGLHVGAAGVVKAQCEARLKLKAPMITDTHVAKPTNNWQVYTRWSSRKVMTQWQAKSAPMIIDTRVAEPTNNWQVYTWWSSCKVMTQWQAKPEVHGSFRLQTISCVWRRCSQRGPTYLRPVRPKWLLVG
jgi:hypothetical protein